jgi:hypothetical protein
MENMEENCFSELRRIILEYFFVRDYASRDQIYHFIHLALRNTTVRTRTPLEYMYYTTTSNISENSKFLGDYWRCVRVLWVAWLPELALSLVICPFPAILLAPSIITQKFAVFGYVRGCCTPLGRILCNFRLRKRTLNGTPKVTSVALVLVLMYYILHCSSKKKTRMRKRSLPWLPVPVTFGEVISAPATYLYQCHSSYVWPHDLTRHIRREHAPVQQGMHSQHQLEVYPQQ